MTTAQRAASQSTVLNWDSTPGLADDLVAGLERSAVGAGIEAAPAASLPASTLIAGAALTAGAAVLGWKLGAPAGAFVYRQITGQPYGGYTGSLASCGTGCNLNWQHFTSGSSDIAATATSPIIHAPFWGLVAGTGTAPGPSNFDPTASGLTGALGLAAQALSHTYTATVTSPAVQYVRTEAAMSRALTVKPITSTAYAALPSGQQLSGGTNPARPSSLTDPQLQGALDAINAGTPGAQDTPDAAATGYIASQFPTTATMPNCVGLSQSACTAALTAAGFTGTVTYTPTDLAGADVTKPAGAVVTTPDPAGTTIPGTGTIVITTNPAEMPILLPQPLLNETYDAYVARLTALGYLGAITFTDLSDTSAETRTGPNAVARLTTTTTVGVQTLSPFAWPAPAPRISPHAAIDIVRNPSTVPEASTPLPPPGGGGGGGSCSCPPLDLTPITGASVGSKFPFGVFTWIGHAIGLFDVTPVTPEVHFPVHLGSTSVHSFADDDFYVNLGFFDGYMATMRTLLTFFMWAAAIWFVASKFLKVDWAGEPGDGTEELL
jgi:hypothetical protein